MECARLQSLYRRQLATGGWYQANDVMESGNKHNTEIALAAKDF